MSKAVVMRHGQARFLVETDESVKVPARLRVGADEPTRGVPPGMEPVVDRGKIEREFADVKQLIVACCDGLLEAIDEISQPSKVVAEFGIKLAGEAGVPMLTKASGEATFKVCIEWTKDQPVPYTAGAHGGGNT